MQIKYITNRSKLKAACKQQAQTQINSVWVYVNPNKETPARYYISLSHNIVQVTKAENLKRKEE